MRHKLLAGIIPFCSGKRKPSTFTSSSLTDCNHITTNNNNMLQSKSTYFYRWSSRYISIAPIACALTLLVGISLLLNPTTKAQEVYAVGDTGCKNPPESGFGDCHMELGITMQNSNGDVIGAYTEQPATGLSTTEPSFRSYSFKVRAIDTADGYKLYANAVDTTLDGKNVTNQLVNADYPEFAINPISSAEGVIGSNIEAGQWGYALEKENGTSDNSKVNLLNYKPLPSGSATSTTPIDTSDTDTDLEGEGTAEKHIDTEYRLHFGAKASEGMASGHYRTQVLLSLVATPKMASGLGITKMSQMTTEHCAKLPTVTKDTPMDKIPTGQLVDDREGANGQKYWVSKLADGNCWMTQNMAYDNVGNTSGTKFDSTKKKYVLNDTTSVNISTMTMSDNPTATDVFPGENQYNAHYLIGNYYEQDQSVKACDFSAQNNSSWSLPKAVNSSTQKSFCALTDSYGITKSCNAVGSDVGLTLAPLFFLRAGGYDKSLGQGGFYRSSTGTMSNFSFLSFRRDAAGSRAIDVDESNGGSSFGFSVRCLVPGN